MNNFHELGLHEVAEYDSVFHIGFFSNKPLLAAVSSTVVLQLAVIYIPFLQGIFKTVPLGWQEIGICLGLSVAVFFAVELE